MQLQRMSDKQFEALPDCFKEIVEIDRQLEGPILDFAIIKKLGPQRRIAKRMCVITVHQPRSGGAA